MKKYFLFLCGLWIVGMLATACSMPHKVLKPVPQAPGQVTQPSGCQQVASGQCKYTNH